MSLSKLKFISGINQYNRKVIQKSTVVAYNEYPYYIYPKEVSFNEGDGVDTYGIEAVNWPDTNTFNPDYLVVYHLENNNPVIDSRWYIAEWNRTKLGQYKMHLHRDMVLDKLDHILDAPAFIERAIIPESDPFIFQPENIIVNQIKQSETLLKDESEIAWIVGYVDPEYEGGSGISVGLHTIPDISKPTKESWEYYPYFAGSYGNGDTYDQTVSNSIVCREMIGGVLRIATYNFEQNKWTGYLADGLNAATTPTRRTLLATGLNNAIAADPRFVGEIAFSEILENVGKVLYTEQEYDGRHYFKIQSSNSITNTPTINTTTSLISVLTEIIDEVWNTVDFLSIGSINSTISVGFHGGLVPMAQGNFVTDIAESGTRNTLKDAPYDMFCIPYGNIQIRNSQVSSWTNFTVNKNEALSLAQGLAKSLTTTHLYDLQLLPYCPITGMTYNHINNWMDINSSDEGGRYNIIWKTGDVAVPAQIMLWATASAGHKIINYNQSVANKKVSDITDFYRLASPNRSGTYEFSAAKNSGIHGFHVYYTYLPFSPFIQINPIYSGLYGQSFADSRGLTLHGDFSLSYTSDSEKEFLAQNKNYATIFQNQLENMDANHRYDHINQALGAVAGTGSAVVTGAALGGPVGAVAGGAASLGAGIADVVLSEKKYQLNRSYAEENFELNFGNIKARGESITKTTAYNEINPIFPILEYYTCTEEEKLAIANKFKYNSFNIGRIGTIREFINNEFVYELGGETIRDNGFIRCKVIQLNTLDDDSHMALAIADELQQGVYFK